MPCKGAPYVHSLSAARQARRRLPAAACLQGLTKLLGDSAPGCMKEQKFENYFGRKIAVDASMHIYSFLVCWGLRQRGQRGGNRPLLLTLMLPIICPHRCLCPFVPIMKQTRPLLYGRLRQHLAGLAVFRHRGIDLLLSQRLLPPCRWWWAVWETRCSPANLERSPGAPPGQVTGRRGVKCRPYLHPHAAQRPCPCHWPPTCRRPARLASPACCKFQLRGARPLALPAKAKGTRCSHPGVPSPAPPCRQPPVGDVLPHSAHAGGGDEACVSAGRGCGAAGVPAGLALASGPAPGCTRWRCLRPLPPSRHPQPPMCAQVCV